jgi:hypothetical protein
MVDSRSYDDLVVNNTNFNDAIIDNPEFIQYLRRNKAQKIPEAVKNRQELESRLETREYSRKTIDYLLSISKLP